MSLPQSKLREGLTALRRDLIHEDGPRISTMRNYRFAILQYDPKEELVLRREVQRLSTELAAHGWMVLSIDLQKLLFDRVRAQGPEWIARVTEMEASLPPERGLNYVRDKMVRLIEGPKGIAADASRIICDWADKHPDKVDHTVALIGRAGALYPFYRSSALLRHLDGQTRNVPVVVLYPGHKKGAGLSFMGVIDPDHDYRPRIYP